MLLGQSGAGLVVLCPLGVWSPQERGSPRQSNKCQLWSGLGTKLQREITLGERGLLQSLFSFLLPTLISAVFSRDEDIYMSPREGVKNSVFCS